MQKPRGIKLSKLVEHFGLTILHEAESYDTARVTMAEVNRPGLQVAGYYDYFVPQRLQILGLMESTYLENLSSQARKEIFSQLFSTGIPALILCHQIAVYPECLEAAAEQGATILETTRDTSDFMAACIGWLKVELAPCITRHGVFVEVYGEGLLLLGESGVGKSEAAIELVKRGHRLIADDAVELRRTSDTALIGTAPESIRHYIELRGIGVINVRRLFGIGAVKLTEKVDMVIHLEEWNDETLYDRLGLDAQFTEVLGIKVPSLTIPVKPGRNLAAIIEVAAMNNRQKRMGYDSAQEFADQINKFFEANAAGLED